MNAKALLMTTLSATLLGGSALALPRTITQRVDLRGGHGARRSFSVDVNQPGWITATYQRSYGPALALMLNGPAGAFDRRDGLGYLRVSSYVRPRSLMMGGRWTISVASFNYGYCRAQGILRITYPQAAPPPPPRPEPIPPQAAQRRTRTFQVSQRVVPGAAEEKVFKCNVPGLVRLSWHPKVGTGQVEVRVRRKFRARYLVRRAGRGGFELAFRVTPAMIARDNAFVIEVVNRNREVRKLRGKVQVNKPVPPDYPDYQDEPFGGLDIHVGGWIDW